MSAKLFKISEAAPIIGLTRQRLYLYVADGRLKTVEAHGMAMVTATEIVRFKKTLKPKPNGNGKPKK